MYIAEDNNDVVQGNDCNAVYTLLLHVEYVYDVFVFIYT